MKLLYHCPCHEGGLADYARHQAEALCNQDDVDLLWHAPKSLAAPNRSTLLPKIEEYRVAGRGNKLQRATRFIREILAHHRQLDRMIAEYHPDAVLMSAWSEYLAPAWSWQFRKWQKQGLPIGAVIHDPVRDFVRGPKWFNDWSINLAYSFLSTAFVHEALQLDTAGAPQPKTVVIPHGPYPVPDGDETQAQMRRRLGIPLDERVLLSFGHIRDGKCLDLILEALVASPDCHLVIAGREQSGGQRPAAHYRQLADRLGVADRCHWFVGYIPNEEVWQYFRVADRLLLLYSNDFHSMSGVLNVNAQFRLPVLASAGGGPLLKAVKNYGLGTILNDTTAGAISEALAHEEQPGAQWDEYLSDHSWETNARLVVNAFQQADGME